MKAIVKKGNPASIGHPTPVGGPLAVGLLPAVGLQSFDSSSPQNLETSLKP